jgi:hypothetical protein
MRSTVVANVAVLSAALSLVAVGPAPAAQDQLAEEVQKGCRTELDTWCKRVHPGQGRLLACLYAYNDKLSGQCEYALYDAAVQLERAVNALAYVANECDADLERFCAGATDDPVRCLETNQRRVSPRCTQALKDVGL